MHVPRQHKSVILAAAGSGKTSHLVAGLDEERRFLIVTYTESNRDNIRNKIIRRFGYFPENVTLYTYFRFLHGFSLVDGLHMLFA